MKTNHSTKRNIVFLATGSNQGDRKAMLLRALSLISSRVGGVLDVSSLYETDPWGNTDQPIFYNQVLKVETELSASQVMKEILEIEKEMGRKRTFRYAPRVIDIDILLFNDEVIRENGIIIPHPYLHERNFVLAPLQEIAPDWEHPVIHKKITKLAAECNDLLKVKRLAIESI